MRIKRLVNRINKNNLLEVEVNQKKRNKKIRKKKRRTRTKERKKIKRKNIKIKKRKKVQSQDLDHETNHLKKRKIDLLRDHIKNLRSMTPNSRINNKLFIMKHN